MTTGLQLAILGGLFVGLGVAMIIWRLAPTDPDLGDALDRLSPENVARTRARRGAEGGAGGDRELGDVLGVWGMRHLPANVWFGTPRKDLAILQMSETQFYGEKLKWSLLGLVIAPVVTFVFTLLGLSLPIMIPTAGSLALAIGFFFIPNYNAGDDAKKAREEFNHDLGAYIEQVGQALNSDKIARVALTRAAQDGDSWAFVKIRQELGLAELASRAPWDALYSMADELGLPALSDFADIMQRSGVDGDAIYTALRDLARQLRSARLSAEIGRANAAGERMWIPSSLVGVVFMAILIAPALLRLLQAS